MLRSISKLLLLVALVGWFAPLAAQESPSFRLERITVASGASSASSTSFSMSILAAEQGVAGSSSFCNSGFLNTLGFWSVLGNMAVPIRLRVSLDPLSAPDAALIWTGDADTFQVFRANSPEDVLNANNVIEETASCDALDALPMATADILFYKVAPKP